MAWLFRQALWERPQSHLLRQAGLKVALSQPREGFPLRAQCRHRRWSSIGQTARGLEMRGPKLRCQFLLTALPAQS